MMKAAVIGCGRMGAFTSEAVRREAPACWFPLSHAEAIVAHPELELAAFGDPVPAALERAQKAYDVAAGYGDFRSLIDAVRPDLVGVATRTVGRAEIIDYCIGAGTRALHVEKPLCNSVDELRSLERLLARDDVFLTYGTIRRFFGVYAAARDLAASGRYGALLEIRVNMGRGLLYWTHPHSVDLLLWAAGGRRVAQVQAKLSGVETGTHATDILSDPVIDAATLWFDDGVAGHIGRAPGADLILSCERGEVVVENDGMRIVVAETPEGSAYPQRRTLDGLDAGAPLEGSYAAIAQLVACLKGDGAARAANAAVKRDILAGQGLSFAMVQSHLEGGRPVSPAAYDPAMRILARTGSNVA